MVRTERRRDKFGDVLVDAVITRVNGPEGLASDFLRETGEALSSDLVDKRLRGSNVDDCTGTDGQHEIEKRREMRTHRHPRRTREERAPWRRTK
jgi:hypothetical protein